MDVFKGLDFSAPNPETDFDPTDERETRAEISLSMPPPGCSELNPPSRPLRLMPELVIGRSTNQSLRKIDCTVVPGLTFVLVSSSNVVVVAVLMQMLVLVLVVQVNSAVLIVVVSLVTLDDDKGLGGGDSSRGTGG